MLIQILALTIATLVPAIVLYIIYSQDLYGTGEKWTVLGCFAWGTAAFALAYGMSRIVFGYDLASRQAWVQFIAPVAEEILKALVLIYLVRRPKFTYFVDGAIYGFAAGMGFAIVENWSYVISYGDAGLSVAVGRVISTNLVHATGCALVGIALGYARFQRYSGRVLLLSLGLAVAMSVHIAFNNVVTRTQNGVILITVAAGIGLLGAAFIFFMIKRGLAEQKLWIEEKLGAADRVTGQEVAVVQRLSDIDRVLAPLAEEFGPHKAKACEQFLMLQARLGIKRKTLDKLADEKMKQAVRAEIDQISAEMDATRKTVGWRVMLYLRTIYPEDVSPVWGLLENAIERAVAARPATGGANLYATLGQRVVARSVEKQGVEDSAP